MLFRVPFLPFSWSFPQGPRIAAAALTSTSKFKVGRRKGHTSLIWPLLFREVNVFPEGPSASATDFSSLLTGTASRGQCELQRGQEEWALGFVLVSWETAGQGVGQAVDSCGRQRPGRLISTALQIRYLDLPSKCIPQRSRPSSRSSEAPAWPYLHVSPVPSEVAEAGPSACAGHPFQHAPSQTPVPGCPVPRWMPQSFPVLDVISRSLIGPRNIRMPPGWPLDCLVEGPATGKACFGSSCHLSITAAHATARALGGASQPRRAAACWSWR